MTTMKRLMDWGRAIGILAALLLLTEPALATTVTKTRTSIWSSQTLTASAGNTTSSVIDLSTVFECQVDIKLTNGGTGPTVPAQVQVVVANNYNAGSPTLLTNYGGALVGTTTNSAVSYFSVTIPIGVAAFELIAGSNTGQNVTVDSDVSCASSIS